MTLPTLTVEVAFGDLPTTPSPSWTDVTSRVLLTDGIKLDGAGARVGETLSAGSLSITFENENGDFTPGKSGGAYGALSVGYPIRVSQSSTRLWTGFITDWAWEYRGGYSVATCQAADVAATLAKAKALPWMTAQHMNASDCTGYWPLNDSEDTNNPANVFGGRARRDTSGTGGVTTLGVESDVSPDSETVAAFTPDGTACQRFSDTATGHASTGDVAISAWVNRSDATNDNMIAYVTDNNGGAGGLMQVAADSTGRVRVVDDDSASWGSADDISIGEWHHVYVYRDQSESNYADRISVWVDGVSKSNGTIDTSPEVTGSNWSYNGGTISASGGINIHIGGPGNHLLDTPIQPWDGQLAHVALFGTSASRTVGYDRGASGDTTGERFAEQVPLLFNATSGSVELAQWFAAANADCDVTMSAQATREKTLHSLLTEIGDTELGRVAVKGDGTVVLKPSTIAAGQTAAVTLSADDSLMAFDGAFTLTDAQEVSQVVITQQPAGTEWTRQRTSTVGTESMSRDVWTSDETHAEQAAYWWISTDRTAVEAPTLAVSIDRVAEDDASLLSDLMGLAADPAGQVVTVTDLPSTAPASSVTFTVDKVDHDITKNGWTMSIATSPDETAGWVLGTSALDSSTILAI